MEMNLYRGGYPLSGKGPAWFTNSRTFAKTYGPVEKYQIDLGHVKEVNLEEWHAKFEIMMVRLQPEGAMELLKDGYQAALLTMSEQLLFVFVPRTEGIKYKILHEK